MADPHGAPLRLVIPANAGIQVGLAELAWILAPRSKSGTSFAGMTEPEQAFSSSFPTGIFKGVQRGRAAAKTFGGLTTEDTEFTEARGEKYSEFVLQASFLRLFLPVLRALYGAMVENFRKARKFSTIVVRRTRRFRKN